MVDPYILNITLLGLVILGAAWIPRIVSDRPLSLPIIYVALGVIIYSLPLDLTVPDPIEYSEFAEHLAELGVIIALTGAALKLDRPAGWRSWETTWRLLAITMPLCIVALALLGWGFLGLTPATALLLGAVMAPTDPVLASDVEAAPPGESDREVNFALTSEAGLNDGLAFPFTNAALAMTPLGVVPITWLEQWFLHDVLYKLGIGLAVGLVAGYGLARIIFSRSAKTHLTHTSTGLMVLAITLLAYGLAELVHAYGFLAVFVAASTVRHYEQLHEHHAHLHDFAEQSERLLMVVILVLFGGSLTGGLLASLTAPAALVGLAFLFLIRPLTGALGLLGLDLGFREQTVISFFGIRGIGSFFYLSHALNEADLVQAELLWATVGFVVLVSILVHGVSASPLLKQLE